MDESRKAFEQYSADMLGLPLEMISDARDGDRYRHSFDRASIMQPLNGWWILWQASRAAIELDIDWPEANDDTWMEGEDGAYARGHEDGKDKVVIAVRQAIRAAGIKVKE